MSKVINSRKRLESHLKILTEEMPLCHNSVNDNFNIISISVQSKQVLDM